MTTPSPWEDEERTREIRESFDQLDREWAAYGYRPKYYNRRGEPISMFEWATTFEGNRRHVAETRLWGSIWISTVWLGLDHSWQDESPPLIFETMVFVGGDSGECLRYSTLAEAARGHRLVIARYLIRLDLALLGWWRKVTFFRTRERWSIRRLLAKYRRNE